MKEICSKVVQEWEQESGINEEREEKKYTVLRKINRVSDGNFLEASYGPLSEAVHP